VNLPATLLVVHILALFHFAGAPSMTPLFRVSPAVPRCAVWVVRNALQSPDAWKQALDRTEQLGCDRIYLQVSGRWDAFFPSAVFPPPKYRATGWGDTDPLLQALGEAHARRMEVHAWVNALLAWSAPAAPSDPAHVYFSHPDWFVLGPDGRSMRALDRQALDRAGLVGEGWFLDPGRVEVRTELRRFLLDLALRYPVDGIHLDYIRYPAGWKPADGDARVERLLALVRQDLDRVRPGLVLSAAVLPRPAEAERSFGQDWPAWLERGLVDEVVPMVYRDDVGAVLGTIEAYPASVPLSRVWVGLRVDRLSPSDCRRLVARLSEIGVPGVVLFSQNSLGESRGWRGSGRLVP